VANVVATRIPGGQWVKGKRFPVEFVICENSTDPKIPVGGKLNPYGA